MAAHVAPPQPLSQHARALRTVPWGPLVSDVLSLYDGAHQSVTLSDADAMSAQQIWIFFGKINQELKLKSDLG